MSTPSPDPTPHASGWKQAPTLPGGASELPRTAGWVPSPAEPTAFGRYQLVRLLGRGGMGSVYLAHDTQLDRQVAVKIPNIQGASPELMERFYREARAAATLHHPNLCPVFDVGEVQGMPYMTMAYIEGEPLGNMIKEGRVPGQEEVVKIVRQVALAIHEAHEKGVVHRDLKPANVMITPKGQPVVMDFGLALRGLDTQEVRLTQTGMIVGTPAYMSPEQVNGNPSIGPASDIYSLGVVLYELLTERIPFDGPPGELMARIAFEQPAPPSRFRQGLPAKLDAVCMRALAKKPEQRFASMADFAEALEGVWTKASRPVAAPAPVRYRPASQRRSSIVAWIIFGGVFLLVLGLFSGGVSGVLRQMGMEEAAKRADMPWETLSRWWSGLFRRETPERLFPEMVGGYRRVAHDYNANCPELNIRRSGWHATYVREGTELDLCVYEVSSSVKVSILEQALKAINAASNGKARPGWVEGEPRASTMAYEMWSITGTPTCGVFHYDRSRLYLARSRQKPDGFLLEYMEFRKPK